MHAAANDPTITTVALVTQPNMVDETVLETLRAHTNFTRTLMALRRRIDRLNQVKSDRAKVFGADVKSTAAALEAHMSGDAWTEYQEAQAEVEEAMGEGTTPAEAILNRAMAYGPTARKLYAAHVAAVKAKKAEMERLGGKIATVEAALAKLLRHGPTGKDEDDIQATLPGLEAQPTSETWMDKPTRQAVLDALASEVRSGENEAKTARAAGDNAAAQKAERERAASENLLKELQISGLLGELQPDVEDELLTAGDAEVDDDVGVEITGEAPAPRTEPVAGEGFTLQPEQVFEDATKHPALASSIETTKKKRAAKKAAGDGKPKTTGKRGRKPKS